MTAPRPRRDQHPQSLVHEWTLPWPLKVGTGELPLVHFAAFDASLFARQDASTAQAWGLGWDNSLRNSVPRRQAEFFFGRWAARAALRESGLPCVSVGSGAAREPLWPPGSLGSITHIDGLAAAAAVRTSDYHHIGLDLERVAVGENQRALRGLVLDQAELKVLAPLVADRLDLWVTIAFSAKESFYKAAYPTVGRFFDFKAARVVSMNPSAGRLQLEVVEPLSTVFATGSRWAVDFDVLQHDVVLTAMLG